MIEFNKMQLKVILYALLTCVLVSCSSEQGDDLDAFMANAANNESRSVDPLPEVLPYTPLQYNVDGALKDPFKSHKAVAGGALQPNIDRPREPLEAFPLESLFYVGAMSKKGSKYALIKTPDEVLQKVRVGNYIGPNFGRIVAIKESVIEIKEVVQDDASGDWVEREASINLQEQ